MENTVDAKLEPLVMTADFINEKILFDTAKAEDLNSSELQKLLTSDGIDSSLISSLNLEHQSLLNISSLWRFSLLTKLELANNFIEEIESLEGLPNLQFLDLSFNCIKTIKCLTELTNMQYLNLSFNEITVLENMEHLTKLESFLVRHNKIQSFNNIYYLIQFKNLLCLGIEGNPFRHHDNIRMHIIAILPQIKFLDFQIVTEWELQKALVVSGSRSKQFGVHSPKDTPVYNSEFSSSWTVDTPDQIAFVEDLANGQGFESFLKSDKNFRALHSYLPVAEVAENHCMEVSEVFNKWHDKGREYFGQMQKEKTEFYEKVKEVQEFSLSLFEEEFQCYVNLKEEIPKELCFIYQKRISSEQRDLLIRDLKEKYIKEIESTHTNLMNASCLCIDLVYKLEKTFETEILQITDSYLQDVQRFYENIMKIDEIYILQLWSFYDNIFDTGSNFDLEYSCQAKSELQLKSVFSKLLSKKAYVEMALKMSISIHSTLLQERIKKLESSLENFKIDAKDQFLKSVFVKQNELTRDIVIFCSKQKYIIDKIFSNSDHFQQYLGYT